MWYETKESKKDLEKGGVLDTIYNNGLIVREQNGKVIREFTEYKMSEEELLKTIWKYEMKEDYFKKSMETLQRIEDNLKEQKYAYSAYFGL